MMTCSNPSADPATPQQAASPIAAHAAEQQLRVRTTAIVPSPMIDTMVTAFAQLIELELEDEAVLDVVEDHLHNIYQTAKTLALQVEAQVERHVPKISRPALAQSLGTCAKYPSVATA